MASESDGIATSGIRGWLDIINGIGWPNLPGIEFDYTDDPDAAEKFNNSETNDSDEEEYYKRVDTNFEAENAFMMEHMSRMSDGELLTYAAELIKFRRLKDFLYINRHEDEITGLPDNVEFLEYEILKCSRDSGYARWIIENEDLTVNFIAAVDPEDYDGEIYREYFGDDDEYEEDYEDYGEYDAYEENSTSDQDEDPKPAKYLGEYFEPELASIEYSGSSYTLGLAREGTDRGNEGQRMGAARWTLECLKMLDDRYEELLDEEERERSRSRLGGIATELSDIE